MWQPLKMIVAGVVGLAGFSLLAQFLTFNVLLDMPAMQAQGEFDQLQREAMMHARVGTNPLQTLAEQSRRMAREKMAAAKSDAERGKIAAAVFMGFWMTNGRGRAELCQEHGVDFSAYRAKFEKRNATLHDKAWALLAGEGMSEERLYQIHRSSIIGHLDSEMRQIEGAVNLREACVHMFKQSGTYLSRMNFQNAQPTAWRAIGGS